ncbi:O-antigen/teichoic acid export membrane protein [Arthrobacter sp. B2I5]|nr:O-antigen/teichoic acid export membrane protein [Arthrobacter sp. B2I5]
MSKPSSTMSTARKLLAGAAWVYGSQLVTVLAQFAYAASTSRSVSPSGFGAYTVALSVTGLVSLLATGGLGQTVSRMTELDRSRLRSLVSYGLVLGFAGALVLFLTAPLWSVIWGVEESIAPMRLLAVGNAFSPLLGLSTGLMARRGKFRQLALITVCSNLIGMAVGAYAVSIWQSASSLVVSALLAQFLILISTVLASEGGLLGIGSLRHGRDDIGYSGKLVFGSLFSYLTGNIVKLSMARSLDLGVLGHWNRAEVITTIPLQQVQAALTRAVYPEFRHDLKDSSRTRIVWTDMLVMVAWIALCLSTCMAVLLPPFVPLIFGPGWEFAASLIAPLAVAGGLQIVSILLTSAMEALGKFRWIWSTDLILILIQICSATLMVVYKNVWVAIVALILTNVIRHGWQVWLAGRHGYVDSLRLLRQYVVATIFSLTLALVLWASLHLVLCDATAPGPWVAASLLTGGFLSMCWLFRRRLPFFVLAHKYGLVSGS